MKQSLRRTLGAALLDLPRFFRRTLPRTKDRRIPSWAWNCNREDRISVGPNGEGITCLWEFTRDLHVTNVFPRLSTYLLRRMLQDWPIVLNESSVNSFQPPVVSFVIGHRGTTRLDHLLLTISSIAGQSGVPIECIVVEQSFEPQIQQHVPDWVRYHFTKAPTPEYLYNRSWAFNEGVQIAMGDVIVLHDGDMLVPTEYSTELLHQIAVGFDVVNLKRFITFLNRSSTDNAFKSQQLSVRMRSEKMMQNATAGGSIGITKRAYWAIGGMDEEFVGWGGEDTEFWDRCQTLKVANHTYLPFVHLWHPAQPGKAAVYGLGLSTANMFSQKMVLPASLRIQSLRGKRTQMSNIH